MRKNNAKLLSVALAIIMVAGMFSFVWAETSELTFTALDKPMDFAELTEVDISKDCTIDIALPDTGHCKILLVPANKKIHYLSDGLISAEGTYQIPKKIGSDQIKKAFIVPKELEEDGDVVHTPNVTSWYVYENATIKWNLLDTSVNIDFDVVDIAKVTGIKFTLTDEDGNAFTRYSTGGNLVTLLKDCAVYWDSSAENYLNVTGDRVLSCAFRYRAEADDNGYWESSACTLDVPEMPTTLKVEIETTGKAYSAVFDL